jgi:hypothetical protein
MILNPPTYQHDDPLSVMALICSIQPTVSKQDQLKRILAKFVPAVELDDTLELLRGAIFEAIAFAFVQNERTVAAASTTVDGAASDVAAVANSRKFTSIPATFTSFPAAFTSFPVAFTSIPTAFTSIPTAFTSIPAASAAADFAVSPATASLPAASTEAPPKKKRRIRKGGDDNLDGRHEVAQCGKDHKAKITMIKAIHDRVGEDKSALTEGARIWYTKNVVKPMRCLTRCHGGSVDQFVNVAIPIFFRSKNVPAGRIFPSHSYECANCKDACSFPHFAAGSQCC